MQRCMEERDVIALPRQPRPIEIADLIADAAEIFLCGGLLCVFDGAGRNIEGVDLARDAASDGRAFEGPQPAPEGNRMGERLPRVNAPEPIERPFIGRSRDASVDGLAAKRMSHPKGRIFGLLAIPVPEVRGLLGDGVRHRRTSGFRTEGTTRSS